MLQMSYILAVSQFDLVERRVGAVLDGKDSGGFPRWRLLRRWAAQG
jgi:hypothetical protein